MPKQRSKLKVPLAPAKVSRTTSSSRPSRSTQTYQELPSPSTSRFHLRSHPPESSPVQKSTSLSASQFQSPSVPRKSGRPTKTPLDVEEVEPEVFEEEEEEEEEEELGFELEELVVEPTIPKKRVRGQLDTFESDVMLPSGSRDIIRVTEAQVNLISDQVARQVASSLGTKLEKTRKKKKL